jgi:DNA-binding response OmpR family regulator
MAILLIEDDIDFGNLLIQTIESNQYEVVHALDGRNALEFLKRGKFELAIIDLTLENENALDIAKMLKMKITGLQFIFLMSKNDREDILGLNLGQAEFICKPFNEDELVSIITKLLQSNLQ